MSGEDEVGTGISKGMWIVFAGMAVLFALMFIGYNGGLTVEYNPVRAEPDGMPTGLALISGIEKIFGVDIG